MRNQKQEKPTLGISWGSSKTQNSCAIPPPSAQNRAGPGHELWTGEVPSHGGTAHS